jgi:phosphomannomutase/phosphoglucomutase
MLVKEKMNKHGALLGAEVSCHFSFKDRYFGFDDGIYAALRLCELLVNSGQTLKKLLSIIPTRYSSPEYRIECEEEQKMLIVEKVLAGFENNPEANLITIDGVRVILPYGWGLIRASNTQPVLSLRFEADSPVNLIKIKKEFIARMHPYLDRELESLLEIVE